MKRRFPALIACLLSALLVSDCLADDVVENSVQATRHASPPSTAPEAVSAFLKTHCADCHSATDPAGRFNVLGLDADLSDSETFEQWVRLFDRVKSGEMPPADAEPVDDSARQAFLGTTGDWLRTHQQQNFDTVGRVRGRRLTKLQVERSLHDLLGVDIPLATHLPDESRTDGFAAVADGQSMSHFQLEGHVALVDMALDEALRRVARPTDTEPRRLDAARLARANPKRRTREPEMLDGAAVVWSSRIIFYGRLPSTTAKEDGWYRFTIRASALNPPRDCGVWCTVRSGHCVSGAPLLDWIGAFEATGDVREWTFDAWMPKGQMLEVRPGDATLKLAKFNGGQVGTGEGGPQNVPGVAIESVVMQRVHHGPDSDKVRKFLFGDLEVRSDQKSAPLTVVSSEPKKDAAQLMRNFARRAFRRPVVTDDVAPYITLVRDALHDGVPFVDALRRGYRAILSSPRFLYFHEQPGALDDFALASRLSYFLWNRMPDYKLLAVAKAGQLTSPTVLREQTRRMLADARGRNFVRDFSAEWLDLHLIDFTEPDRRLFPDFDIIVQQSMLDETHTYLQTMIDDNLSLTRLIDSDFTFLNSRLARFYAIDGVTDDELQRVSLQPSHHRGGLLTQGAILKVTANGTNTSPVTRGVWVAERLLGEHIPPPPNSVPAIEPDIRGTRTMREMLAKHRSDSDCAACHRHIDPPGFALENYDPAGRWRERYVVLKKGGKDRGSKVDASYQLADGREFSGIDGYRRLILLDPKTLARNVANQLLTVGTGASPGFADRPAIESIIADTAQADFGFRSIVEAVVTSPVFLQK